MLSQLPKTAQTLLKAADIIRERGWHQGCLVDSGGQVCVMAAIGQAEGVAPPNQDAPNEAHEQFYEFVMETLAYVALQRFLGLGSLELWEWNDMQAADGDEVLATLEAAAASVASSSVAAEGEI